MAKQIRKMVSKGNGKEIAHTIENGKIHVLALYRVREALIKSIIINDLEVDIEALFK